jgi:hypothetical protein
MSDDKSKPEAGRPTAVSRLTLRQQEFFNSEAGRTARLDLKLMANDPAYNTRPVFSSREAESMTFVERHMEYLSEHPNISPRHYLSNLRLKTKLNI